MIKERYILILFLIVLAVGITYRFLDSLNPNPKVIHSVQTSNSLQDTKEEKANGKINLNTAGFDDFLRLPGIGKVKAKSILDYREKKGRFERIEEIMNVPGIGKKTFERIKDMIFVEGENVPSIDEKNPTVSKSKLDINTATLDELIELPGIGEVKAREIIKYRTEHGPFTSVDDLIKVKGIGKKTLEKLRKYIKVGGR